MPRTGRSAHNRAKLLTSLMQRSMSLISNRPVPITPPTAKTAGRLLMAHTFRKAAAPIAKHIAKSDTAARASVRRAPSKTNPGRFVDIRITNMTAADALSWDRHLGPHHARDRRRADCRWVWSVLLPISHLDQQGPSASRARIARREGSARTARAGTHPQLALSHERMRAILDTAWTAL